MVQLTSEFLRTIVERGYLHQCTDLEALDARAARETIVAYIGFDATADSLHVGSLLQIMLLRRLQQAGHKPIVLIGGGTTRVGDPSGKDSARQLLSREDIAANAAALRGVFDRFLTFGDGPTDAIMVDNDEWLDALVYLDFLRDYGRHFSVNHMLGYESVKLRLEREQPLSFLEFNYMVLQAYDFLELWRRYDCRLQLGGSDQWGNIIGGVELGRRVDGETFYGLTAPLITTAAGAKMGKTAAGAVWLNADKLSPYDYWQFWRNTEDADVGRFLRLFTDLPLDEIARLEALDGAEINAAKKVLANETTALCHGRAAAEMAEATAAETFERGGSGEALPEVTVPGADLDQGIAAFRLFTMAGLCASNGEARRLLRGGGGRLNGERIEAEDQSIGREALDAGGALKLSAGRKRHALVRPD
ncbi:MAG: tyrosine--tRNA ligase [Alphaproteobacteria bacterium]|nr:tyrosine--tRNA ligase [Alphaproteobacteria bacterium]